MGHYEPYSYTILRMVCQTTYFPNNISNYAEPFAGLARTAEYVKCNTMYLNDLSQYSNEYCK